MSRTSNRHVAGAAWRIVVMTAMAIVAPAFGQDEPPDGQPQKGPPPALVRVGQVDRRQVQQKRLIVGQVEPIRQSEVASEESGRVIQAPPDPGTAVNRGAVLVKLDGELLSQQRTAAAAQVTEAQADVERVKAELALAERMRQRYADLLPTDAATKVEYDQAVRDEAVSKAHRALAEATLAHRRAVLGEYDQRLERMTIAAPFEGIVIARSTELGQWLSPGRTVATVIAIDRVDAVLEVPETMVGELAADQPILLRVPAVHADPKGKVHRIVPSADRTARTFPVWVRVDNRDHRLMPGMTVQAELPTGRRIEALTVPRDAVQIIPGGARVFAVRGEVAVPVMVNIRFAADDRVVVDAALEPGEQVVIEGNERLLPGQPLNIQPAIPPAE